jgi:hypothetical protein
MKKILAAILVTVAMTGTAIAGSNYKVNVSAPAAKVSTRSVAKITVEPTAGYKMNLEYPTKVTLTAPEGVTLEKAKITLKDADAAKIDKASAQFDVAYTADKPGKKTITGEVKFAVCTENDCIPQSERLSFDIDVK